MSTTLFKTNLYKGPNNIPVANTAPVIVQGVEIGATYRERDSRLRETHRAHDAKVEKVEDNFVTLRRPSRTTKVQLQNFLERYRKVSNANS